MSICMTILIGAALLVYLLSVVGSGNYLADNIGELDLLAALLMITPVVNTYLAVKGIHWEQWIKRKDR